MLVVDIWTMGSILEKGGKHPNFLYKLIGVINLGKVLAFGIELEIMKLTHYMVEQWTWIGQSLTFENIDILSVNAFIIYLDIFALGYRWRVVVIAVDNA